MYHKAGKEERENMRGKGIKKYRSLNGSKVLFRAKKYWS